MFKKKSFSFFGLYFFVEGGGGREKGCLSLNTSSFSFLRRNLGKWSFSFLFNGFVSWRGGSGGGRERGKGKVVGGGNAVDEAKIVYYFFSISC